MGKPHAGPGQGWLSASPRRQPLPEQVSLVAGKLVRMGLSLATDKTERPRYEQSLAVDLNCLRVTEQMGITGVSTEGKLEKYGEMVTVRK